jgi:hypothetical protein
VRRREARVTIAPAAKKVKDRWRKFDPPVYRSSRRGGRVRATARGRMM